MSDSAFGFEPVLVHTPPVPLIMMHFVPATSFKSLLLREVRDLPEVTFGILEVRYPLAPRLSRRGLHKVNALLLQFFVFSVRILNEDRIIGSVDRFLSRSNLFLRNQLGNAID